MAEQGTLFIYSGPSGVGKGTLLGPLMDPDSLRFSVSMTTRAPRPGEADGREYFFVSREAFEETIASGGLLEYAQYNGNYYGTPRKMVEEELAQGRDVILEIEVQGARQVRKAFPQAVSIFILPPSYEFLCERLAGRGTESPQVVENRLAQAKRELLCAGEYDYIIVNGDVETARKQLQAVLTAAKCEKRFMDPFIEKVCEFA